MANTADSPQRSVTAANSSSLYLAVEALKDRASSAFVEFEADGDFNQLIDDLGYIRERANAIQDAVLGAKSAIESNL